MKDNFSATEKALNQISEFFDERVGKDVLVLLDKLYAKGYTPTEIRDLLATVLHEEKRGPVVRGFDFGDD